jgi:hypothetical protein
MNAFATTTALTTREDRSDALVRAERRDERRDERV